QTRGTHFHRLLHHVVQPRMFERRKNISKIREAVLGAGPARDGEDIWPLATGYGCLPFALASVERQNGVAGRQPQHIAEIVALVPLQGDAGTLGKWRIDKEPGRTKVEFRHRACSHWAAVLT